MNTTQVTNGMLAKGKHDGLNTSVVGVWEAKQRKMGIGGFSCMGERERREEVGGGGTWSILIPMKLRRSNTQEHQDIDCPKLITLAIYQKISSYLQCKCQDKAKITMILKNKIK